MPTLARSSSCPPCRRPARGKSCAASSRRASWDSPREIPPRWKTETGEDTFMPTPPDHVKLFIPGPTEVRPDVLAEMSRPIISHRGAEMAALQREVSAQAGRILHTSHPVLLS